MSAGDFEDSERCLMSAQRLSRKRRSVRSSSSLAPVGGGADDEAAGGLALFAEQNLLQAAAFAVGLDLARDAGVVDRRHEDQEAAGESDVRGDARALLGDGLLGDLDQNLLAGLEQIADGGQIGRLHGAAAAATVAAAADARGRRSRRCSGDDRHGHGRHGVRRDGHRGGRGHGRRREDARDPGAAALDWSKPSAGEFALFGDSSWWIRSSSSSDSSSAAGSSSSSSYSWVPSSKASSSSSSSKSSSSSTRCCRSW